MPGASRFMSRGLRFRTLFPSYSLSNFLPSATFFSPKLPSLPHPLLSAYSTLAGSSNGSSFKSTLDAVEIEKFATIAETWWDHNGPYKALHEMNNVRLSFISSALCRHFSKDPNIAKPLERLQIVDVGCGGGLACEPLARMGGNLMGIDALEKNINIAKLHALKDPKTTSIQYRCATAEQLAEEKHKFDVVISLEVIEHVKDPNQFFKSLAALVKTNGVVIVSTINRSISAFGLAVVAAEYVLGWVPKGTHDWAKLVTPEELALLMDQSSISMVELAGMVFNPFRRQWYLSDDTSVSYIAYGVKET